MTGREGGRVGGGGGGVQFFLNGGLQTLSFSRRDFFRVAKGGEKSTMVFLVLFDYFVFDFVVLFFLPPTRRLGGKRTTSCFVCGSEWNCCWDTSRRMTRKK